jgi:DNA-binding response OmpR family regulator
LVAYDNKEIRSALCLVLRELCPGCKVDEAGDGDEARRHISERGAALVLLDWDHPGMRAGRLLDEIRLRHPGSAVIAMSSRTEERDEAMSAGVTEFVCTNDPPEGLVSLLGEMVSARLSRPDSA